MSVQIEREVKTMGSLRRKRWYTIIKIAERYPLAPGHNTSRILGAEKISAGIYRLAGVISTPKLQVISFAMVNRHTCPLEMWPTIFRRAVTKGNDL
jgi:hypothetical protein